MNKALKKNENPKEISKTNNNSLKINQILSIDQ